MKEKTSVQLPKRVKNQRVVSAEVVKLARELCSLYYAALKRSLQEQTRGSRGGLLAMHDMTTYDSLEGSSRRDFRRAAEACLQVGADPREFITAQFQRWAEMSQLKSKILLPMPVHLASVGAQARFIQYKLRKAERQDRQVLPEKQHRNEFFTEDRKLKGLVRVLRQPEEEVLTEKPEEFSKQYLKHRGVWKLVAEVWNERHN